MTDENDPRVIAGGKLQDAAMLIDEVIKELWPKHSLTLTYAVKDVRRIIERLEQEVRRELPS